MIMEKTDTAIDSMYFTNIRAFEHCHGVNFGSYNRSFGDYVEFKKINIVIGDNGSGKSTVLDAIKSLVNPQLLASLPKDNLKNNEKIKLYIKFRNQDVNYEVKFRYFPDYNFMREKRFNLSLELERNKQKHYISSILFDKFRRVRLARPYYFLSKVEKGRLGIYSLDMSNLHLNHLNDKYKEKYDKNFSTELNNIVRHLHGVTNFHESEDTRCFGRDQDGNFSVVLSSDPYGLNRLEETYLPSGWRRYGELLAFIGCLPDNSVCIIDEPEVHLHPRLQRLFILRVKELSTVKNLQFFIGTHSPSIINNLDYSESKLFFARINSLDEVRPSKLILNSLGYKLSDYLQTDGVIWVEGPSDKIYLMSWLKGYAKYNRDKEYHFDMLNFEFLFYGGSTLSSFGKDEELIDFLTINQNSAIIIDNDNDYDLISGEIKQASKKRVFEEYNAKSGSSSACWITHGYTIESYLPEKFVSKYFETKNKRLKKSSGYSKTRIAELSIEQINTKKLLDENAELNVFMGELLSKIEQWNGF
ncbi:AAA family ATPase [Vibrio parahaemolyticus]|nr:AAA family ATPase [Vibrio parahaemolyticus]MDG2998429.1 AAA family ATPase [Vibrio parahaemolyticus]MDG3036274.1 AAA family ATPase [Vibrio parahaemolyticus]